MARPRRTLIATCASVAVLSLGCSSGDPSSQDGRPAPGPSSQTPTATAAQSPTASTESTVPADPAGQRIQDVFFGMHDGRVAQGIALDAPVGALRLWDSGTSWRDLETSPGEFTWTTLDTAVRTIEGMGARPLLVLGQTPGFHASKPAQEAAYGPGAASMPDVGAFRRYVSVVAERYRNRIDYQVWNEANVIGYWTGTPQQMAELTVTASRAIRAVAPGATVVAPPFALRLPSQQRYFEDFWSLQSRRVDLASAVDAVAVHLYPPAEDPPEAQVTLLGQAREVLAENEVQLPVWNTEINFGLRGGLPPDPIPVERQRAFVMRAYILNAGLGVQRMYWYRWDLIPIANTLLTTPDFSQPTLAGRAIPTLVAWLDGTRVGPCEPTAGVWQCTARAGRETRTFWWKPQGGTAQVRAELDAVSWTDADGVVTRCRGGCQVSVGQTPVMVTSR